MELKRGNGLYKQEAYQDALLAFQKGLELDPDATFAWRSVGLTSMALYRPGNKTPENLEHANRALEAFKTYLVDHPESPKVLEYLINFYLTLGMYDEGIAYLTQFATEHPENMGLNMSMVTLMTKAGKVVEALDWANNHSPVGQEDPVVYYTIGVNAWDKSYNDVNLTKEFRPVVIDTGLAAMERALQIKRDFQTLVYYNLLYREKAKLFLPDPLVPTPKPGKITPEQQAADAERQAKYDEYLGLANKYATEASELKKEEDRLKAEQEKAQGIGDGHLPPQPVIPGTEPTMAPESAVPAGEGTPGPETTPGAETTPRPETTPGAEALPAAAATPGS